MLEVFADVWREWKGFDLSMVSMVSMESSFMITVGRPSLHLLYLL